MLDLLPILILIISAWIGWKVTNPLSTSKCLRVLVWIVVTCIFTVILSYVLAIFLLPFVLLIDEFFVYAFHIYLSTNLSRVFLLSV